MPRVEWGKKENPDSIRSKEIFPKKAEIPVTESADKIIDATKDLSEVLQNLSSDTPFP